MKRIISVVGAVIEQEDNILCALRSPSMSLPLHWEFPGGKIQEGEKPEEALVREINEELGCTIEVKRKIVETNEDNDNTTINLSTFFSEIKTGTPLAFEHDKIQWIHKRELNSLKWAPADIPTVEFITKYM
ncbi:(deoxy)nucleoside triphosphate pyrophosphohydrolase [Halobacillus amylolyticus]|uniref:8-oxo-dGTP diphosphatase n=1 Tax=Halobacillus amylolyticus TaxID=2932259 RepID=A0ABY4HGU9_9BACI|nr:(deoxy)nucleoside triphosphate pyrophosphohydrolase [Halobacillus amylolyticus]UOR13602.1 (deoxy)nucleoside triphosphate pyrophosphohydrolase [Halobacillus amylolyticus]